MNELKIFNYNDMEVRTVERDGEPWFVLRDVCQVLEMTTPARVAERLDQDEKGVSLIHTPGGPQEMTIINESGLYNVILRSDKPEAKPFRKWVTSEVLPSIRKHGAYMTPETLEAAILNPDTMIRLCTALKDEQDKRKALEAANSVLTVDNQIMKPKAGGAEHTDQLPGNGEAAGREGKGLHRVPDGPEVHLPGQAGQADALRRQERWPF